MQIRDDLRSLVGNTPLVALDRIGKGLPARIAAKLEMLNPGGSVKDRIGEAMILAAEKEGKLGPGGVIVEPTSGNTGVGLAISAARRGYRCIFVMPDKMSQEKIALLRAYGSEVIVCPTDVPPESPRSYYSVADRLSQEIPNAILAGQYHNPANPQAHYETTGPEIWEQTEGKIDAFVCGVGTGGTITGVGRYLKERNPDVVVIGADPEGSIYTQPEDIHPYLTEGIGEDFYPTTFDPAIVDRWEKVSDKETFHMARRITREEGILVGGSCGTAAVAAVRVAREMPQGSLVIVLFPDGGRAYLSKLYSDTWMSQNGFLETAVRQALVKDILDTKGDALPPLVHVHPEESVGAAIEVMREFGVSQVPVIKDDSSPDPGAILGSIRERHLLEVVLREPNGVERKVIDVMDPPLPMADIHESVDSLVSSLGGDSPAVIVLDRGKPTGVITRSDLLTFFAERSQAG